MAVPQEVRDQVDSALATLWNSVVNRQDTYFTNFGRYAQCLWTHNMPPADGATALPDVGTAIPYYERAVAAWPLAVRQTQYPFRLAVHQYVTPDGTPGFVGIVQVLINGNVWERTAQVGPEPWRQHPWAQAEVGA